MTSAYTTQTPIRKPYTLSTWLEHEHTQAYREDCERPVHAASLKTVAYYAHLSETEGYALRTPDRHVFFIAEGKVTELYDADIPRLHLHGRVDLVNAVYQMGV